MEDWEHERLLESDEVEKRFSDCLEQLSNGKYYVAKCGRGRKDEMPIEALEHIDFGLIRHGSADEQFISFIDVVGRNLAINSYPDYPVRDYKGTFIEKVLQYFLTTFIVQEMKREPRELIYRYIWVEGVCAIKYSLELLPRLTGEPQWNHPVPSTEWQRGLDTFLKYIEELPDATGLYIEYKNVPFNVISGVGYTDE